MGNFDLELRSSKDPLLSALALTHGTLDFGPSTSELVRNAFVLLAISCVLALPSAWAWCLPEDSACKAAMRRAAKQAPCVSWVYTIDGDPDDVSLATRLTDDNDGL